LAQARAQRASAPVEVRSWASRLSAVPAPISPSGRRYRLMRLLLIPVGSNLKTRDGPAIHRAAAGPLSIAARDGRTELRDSAHRLVTRISARTARRLAVAPV
jgi:hypothetical protein